MIPHRLLDTEICGSGLKHRVTACRKRLRVNRAMHKPRANYQRGKVFGTPDAGAELPDFTDEYPAMRESLLSDLCSSSFQDEPAEVDLMVSEEVGIT